jgi:hypothetical protein
MTRRVEAGPILVTVGALLLLASLFMDWYTGDITAWEAFEVWDVVLLVLAVGCIIAGIGMAVPDLDVVDRRWLPWAAGAVTLIALSQILDPPPAAAGQDPDLGGIFALSGAAVMIAGGLLTFGRVGVAFTMEPRDPRRRVEAVDARGPADPVTDSHEPVPPSAADDDAPPPEAGTQDKTPSRGGRLFARSERKPEPSAEDAPAAVSSETRATEPMPAEEGTDGPPPKQEA